MDEAISSYVRRNYNLLIGEGTAEGGSVEIGAARKGAGGDDPIAHVRGRDVARGVPSEITLTQAQVAEAVTEPVSRIVHVVRSALEQTQPEMAADELHE